MSCIVCHWPIEFGQRVISLSAGGVARWGDKSQALYVDRDNDRQDIIHEGCVIGYFHPDYNQDIREALFESFRVQIRAEEIDDLKREAEEGAEEHLADLTTGMANGRICTICHEELEEDSLAATIWNQDEGRDS